MLERKRNYKLMKQELSLIDNVKDALDSGLNEI